jgi:hypothetical protein
MAEDNLLADSLVTLAMGAANGNTGLEQTLSQISTNPLGTVIADLKSTISYYTANNFAGLDVELASIASNPAMNTAYNTLKSALGGGDGLSGAVSYLNRFQDHTDRLSGVALASDSPFANNQNDSTSEYSTFFGLEANSFTNIISFPANKYRSGKYLVQASADKEHQLTELYVMHDNKNVFLREVLMVMTQDPFVVFTGTLVDNTVRVLANTAYSNTDMVVDGTRLQIATKAKSSAQISQKKILEQAAAMRAYAPSNKTDHVAAQAGSILKVSLVADLSQKIKDIVPLMRDPSFVSSQGGEAGALTFMANTINTMCLDLQNSVDNDIASYDNIAKQIEALEVLYILQTHYANSKSVVELTTTSSVKGDLKKDG